MLGETQDIEEKTEKNTTANNRLMLTFYRNKHITLI